jgi:hypothetical protein
LAQPASARDVDFATNAKLVDNTSTLIAALCLASVAARAAESWALQREPTVNPALQLIVFGGTSSASGGGVGQLPAGATGIWTASNFAASPRKMIKNEIVNGTADSNLLIAPRREFSNSALFIDTATLVDANATAPDGTLDASTLTASAGGTWAMVSTTTTVPAGTYTVAVSVKYGGTGGTGFKLGDSSSTTGTFTATASWQRFTQTFTTAGAINMGLSNVDASAANLLVCDFQLFAGSSDLNTNALTQAPLAVQNTDLIIGKSAFDASSTVSGGAYQHGSFGMLQFPATVTPSAFTILYVAARSALGTNTIYQPIVAKTDSMGGNWVDFSTGPHVGTNVGTQYNSNNLDATYSGAQVNAWGELFAGVGAGNFVGCHRFDGATSSTFINNTKLYNKATAPAAPTFKDLYVGLLSHTFFSGHDIVALAYYPRALSDAEVKAAYLYLAGKYTINAPRTVVFTGSSLTFGIHGKSYAYLFPANASPAVHGVNCGVGGAILADLNTRAAALDALLSNAIPTQEMILSVEIGVNDLGLGGAMGGNPSGFLTALAAHLDARRAAGWKVVAHTILANLSQTDGGTQFLSERATVNTAIRGWVGTHCDALADWASDATIGIDTAPNNATIFFTDKLHPIDAGYVLLEPYTRAAINSL